jgi:3-dehydroquinate synthase
MNQEFLFIYGPPGSGKSSIGRHLAQQLGTAFFDLDEVIVAQAEMSIPEIFEIEGEDGFRQRESAALVSVLNDGGGVVALGGGALLRAENRQRVENVGKVLCLEADFNAIAHRLEMAAGSRPLLDGDTRARLRQLLELRQPHYRSFSDRLDTTHLTVEEAAWQAQINLGCYHVKGMGAGYDVRVQPGGVDVIGEALRKRQMGGPIALVSDHNVAAQYANRAEAALRRVGYDVYITTIIAGEEHKTPATLIELWQSFVRARLERSSTVVALGGGVVGDLAGFAAATFLRGVPWVAVPTSLLAMVDASLGGKTGADLPEGKNLIGAFHPPSLVLADPQTLQSLPEAEMRNGMAEVVKHGVLADAELFSLCSRGWEAARANLDEIVRRAMSVKIRVIQEDPYERGKRAALNLGHTLGHALELASGYHIRHGEAVAIGMVQAARLAERRGLAVPGLADEIAEVLRTLGLPVEIPAGLDMQRLLAGIGVDKKRKAGKLRLVLPTRIGEVRWGVEIDDPAELLFDALRQ